MTKDFVHCNEVSLAQGLVVDHAHVDDEIIVLMRDLSASKEEFETYLGFTVATSH